jgi:hypothetical protein
MLVQVWVSAAEVTRIAAHLNLPKARFLQAYTQKYTKRKGWFLLRDVYDDNAKVRYEAYLNVFGHFGYLRCCPEDILRLMLTDHEGTCMLKYMLYGRMNTNGSHR